MYSLKELGIVPDLYYVGRWTSLEKEPFRILVMDKLGFNLEELFNRKQRKFPLETLLGIAERFL